jgi:hypothetical protein
MVPIDSILERKTAVFQTNYAMIIDQFKKGARVRVQLRFWPTWPATGPQEAVVQLKGFAKRYTEMLACR